MPSRRQILGAVAALGLGGVIHHRGLRYPRLGFEPAPLAKTLDAEGTQLSLQDAMFTTTNENVLSVRATGLEPKVSLSKAHAEPSTIRLGNVANKAQLRLVAPPGAEVHENVTGITREISIKGAGQFALEWFLQEQDGANFAVIGDTGAGQELEWVLQRAAWLGADFLLHLGDFNYQPGEYDQAVKLFNSSPIPVFVSIGNHDFNDSGLVYDQFVNQLGPLNYRFQFAGAEFISIDTAADFFPAYSGQRGRLLDEIEREFKQTHGSQTLGSKVCFTHRNFLDPRPGRDHTIGGVGEKPWLADKLHACGVENILTGHVHHSAEMEYRNLNQFTVGEGLGFEDIVHEKQVAQLLLGQVETGRGVKYQWAALELPWAMHTSAEHEEKLRLEHPPSKLEWYRRKLATSV